MSDTTLAPQGDYDLTKVTRDTVIDGVRTILDDLNATGNVSRARKALSSLENINDVSGIGRAYLLWGMQKWYNSTSDEHPEPFFATINMTDSDKIVYARRLIAVWDAIEKKLIPAKVQKRSIKDLIPIASVIEDGYDISAETWDKLAQAPNIGEIGRIIRDEIRKSPPRKGTLQLSMSLSGDIYAEINGERRHIGYLDVVNEAEFEITKKGIAKIVHNSPIRRTE